jgi:hypothetical protein
MHVSSYVLFGVIAGAWVIVAKRDVTEVARRAVWFAPSALAALAWWHAGSLVRGPVPTENDIGHMNIVRSLNAFPVWTFDVWEGHVDEACGALWWTAFGVAMFLGLRRPGRPKVLVLIPFAVAAAIYLVTPFRIGNASMLNVRLAPLVALLAVLPLASLRGKELARTKWPLTLVTVASMLTSINTAYEARRASSEMVGDFDALLTKMEHGKRVVMMNYERDSPRTHFWPYVFAGSYHRALHGGVASWSFTELPHWPLHYAPGAAPPPHHPFWVFSPEVYSADTDGPFYDYALVQGDPAAFEDGSDRRFEQLASSGKFTLYAKTTTAH